MEHQKLTHITRGLQNAAAETNSLVSQQYIRVMSEYFDKMPDGTLRAKMVRVELDDQHYALVPLVSLAAPTGLGLDRMKVELSIRLENAEEERTHLFSRLGGRDQASGGEGDGDDSKGRSQFKVSLSPRSKGEGGGRPSDHVHIELEFRALETPESIQRVIETYTNMLQPIKKEPPVTPSPTPTSDGGPNAGPEATSAPDSAVTPDDGAPPKDDKA